MNQIATAATTQLDMLFAQAQAFYARNQKTVLMVAAMLAIALVAGVANAGTAADTWAANAFTFINNMSTGNVVRAICIVGGLLGGVTAAVTGKPILALTGVGIGIFAFLAPAMINGMFGTALI